MHFSRTVCIMLALNSQCTCYFLKTYLARLLETNLVNQFRSCKLIPNYFQFIRPIGQNLRRMSYFLRRMKINIFG